MLIPFNDKVSVSQKIKSSAERARLKQLLQSIKPKNFGVIIRTVAEGRRVAELDNELKILLKHWENAVEKFVKAQTYPTLIYEETSRTVALLRDLFNPSFESIYINDKTVFQEVKNYVTLIAPERAEIVKLYKGNLPIFDNFNITKQIKPSFGKTVSYKNGAYLIIEHTEALHVVDVNSGNRAKTNNQEGNALEVNLGAADELARQLRLRDMGGIIVVDFIDMSEPANRQTLYERMCKNMQNDRARHNILPLSKFGLMQITRQRVRPAMDVVTTEDCPTCHGTGSIKSSILFTDTLESKIDYLSNKLKVKNFTLHIHPYPYAYISQGILSIKRKWQMKYGFGVKIVPNQKLAFLEYRFYDIERLQAHAVSLRNRVHRVARPHRVALVLRRALVLFVKIDDVSLGQVVAFVQIVVLSQFPLADVELVRQVVERIAPPGYHVDQPVREISHVCRTHFLLLFARLLALLLRGRVVAIQFVGFDYRNQAVRIGGIRGVSGPFQAVCPAFVVRHVQTEERGIARIVAQEARMVAIGFLRMPVGAETLVGRVVRAPHRAAFPGPPALDAEVIVGRTGQLAPSRPALQQPLCQLDAGRDMVFLHLAYGQILILLDILQISRVPALCPCGELNP